jgi:hypothetical protein
LTSLDYFGQTRLKVLQACLDINLCLVTLLTFVFFFSVH